MHGCYMYKPIHRLITSLRTLATPLVLWDNTISLCMVGQNDKRSSYTNLGAWSIQVEDQYLVIIDSTFKVVIYSLNMTKVTLLGALKYAQLKLYNIVLWQRLTHKVVIPGPLRWNHEETKESIRQQHLHSLIVWRQVTMRIITGVFIIPPPVISWWCQLVRCQWTWPRCETIRI